MRHHASPSHHVAARFPTDAEAMEAIRAVESLPHHEHLRLEVHRGADHEMRVAEGHLVARVALGMAFGIPLGMMLGLAIMNSVDRWVTPVSGGLAIGTGVGAGFMFGLLVGGLAGLAFSSNELELAREIDCLHLRDEEDVVIADLDRVAHRRQLPEQIADVFAAHHGQLVHL